MATLTTTLSEHQSLPQLDSDTNNKWRSPLNSIFYWPLVLQNLEHEHTVNDLFWCNNPPQCGLEPNDDHYYG